MRGLSGFGVPAGFAPAGVLVAGAAPLPVPLPAGAPEVDAGVETAGVVAGNDVSGVGSGGNGFDRTDATNSFIPASDAL